MTFQRIVIALLVLIVAGLGAIAYVEWKMAVQVRTLKAFVEGYVFNEAVMACEQAKSSTPFKWNGGKSTSVIGLNSVKLDKYNVSASYTLVADLVYCDYDPIKRKAEIGSSFLEREERSGPHSGMGSSWRRGRGNTGFCMRRPCGTISPACRT
ncbi:hypothetical protein [Bradyrhizobium guangxiense]|uniref:hypothetical protein n=1 Tax=Bradyrhizobium guangxiense TaxID=1325115 RepID=UPI001FDEB37D|nr:hypothetical protein [Bradyrhizobium guangxiense]